jgi:hypothetical protein
MIKYRFVAWIILGFLVGLNGFSQSRSSGSQNRCNAQTAAYEAARDKCLDYNAQVAALKAQIEAFKHDQELLLSQCNQQKQQAACDRLAELQDGHLAALEQQYYALASVGCVQSGITPKELAATCAAGGSIPTSNQNKTAPTSSGKTPPNNTSNAPPPRQNPSADRSFHTPPSRMQQQPATSGASGGNSFSRQSGFGGSGGGQVSPPPSASATGTGRVK